MKKILALVLAVIIISMVFVSCGDSENGMTESEAIKYGEMCIKLTYPDSTVSVYSKDFSGDTAKVVYYVEDDALTLPIMRYWKYTFVKDGNYWTYGEVSVGK